MLNLFKFTMEDVKETAKKQSQTGIFAVLLLVLMLSC